jgi:hypothetical protein
MPVAEGERREITGCRDLNCRKVLVVKWSLKKLCGSESGKCDMVNESGLSGMGWWVHGLEYRGSGTVCKTVSESERREGVFYVKRSMDLCRGKWCRSAYMVENRESLWLGSHWKRKIL